MLSWSYIKKNRIVLQSPISRCDYDGTRLDGKSGPEQIEAASPQSWATKSGQCCWLSFGPGVDRRIVVTGDTATRPWRMRCGQRDKSYPHSIPTAGGAVARRWQCDRRAHLPLAPIGRVVARRRMTQHPLFQFGENTFSAPCGGPVRHWTIAHSATRHAPISAKKIVNRLT